MGDGGGKWRIARWLKVVTGVERPINRRHTDIITACRDDNLVMNDYPALNVFGVYTSYLKKLIAWSIWEVSYCGASLLITVVWLMDLWILDLLFPHSSNISLALVPFSSFPLLSFSCLLFVADCHVNFPPFLLHSHFVDWSLSGKLTFPLFSLHSKGTILGKQGACSWSLNECDSCCC